MKLKIKDLTFLIDNDYKLRCNHRFTYSHHLYSIKGELDVRCLECHGCGAEIYSNYPEDINDTTNVTYLLLNHLDKT
jgi:hypothetical protein